MNEAGPNSFSYQITQELPWLKDAITLSEFWALVDAVKTMHMDGRLNRAFGYNRF